MAGTKGRSARGEHVDFDQMKLRQQLKQAPKPVEVKKREEMIISKRRRKVTPPEPVEQDAATDVTEDAVESDEKKSEN